MSNVHGTNGWHHQMLQQWLLLILKFAIRVESGHQFCLQPISKREGANPFRPAGEVWRMGRCRHDPHRAGNAGMDTSADRPG